ncbi:MAG TPA: hemerythrin domain-containing protein [Intrasporangium sp.]|uniref:hemerythrin domain-containing protein n=1 Tax=Intrasporangium sp. TaxID=1925024 RepID=UPI002D776EED|nr:hemerythrin domain-containing protein [Intrasporangium sp.]HET7398177.1 hemerythrin domain-containing protein [Intrasporangium sp.]
MDPSLTAYLDRVRAQRAELHDSVRALDDTLASPLARGAAWRERVRAALAELSSDLDVHVELTEGPGGLYDRLSRAAPRLSGPLGRLREEHEPLREAVRGFLAALEEGDGASGDLPAFREEVTLLLGRLVRHRQTGTDLVYEAYEVDLGGSE